jgi:DeoR/GlpR family transcriptional regulator of sugar metabolism
MDARRRAMAQAVFEQGAVRIEELAARFGVSLMTAHRDLDYLVVCGLLRKSRGMATAVATNLIESSDVYREGRQVAEKEALARAALKHVEPGQAIFMDDSTTVRHMAKGLASKTPLTVITNVLPLISDLTRITGISLVALGGNYYNWCSSFMGRSTTEEISRLRADAVFMSTAAIVDDICFHQYQETVDVKHAMLTSSARKILLADHTKFERRALHGLASLNDFDLVIVDAATPAETVAHLRGRGVEVQVAAPGGEAKDPKAGAGEPAAPEPDIG